MHLWRPRALKIQCLASLKALMVSMLPGPIPNALYLPEGVQGGQRQLHNMSESIPILCAPSETTKPPS